MANTGHQKPVFLENLDMNPPGRPATGGGPTFQDGDAPSSYAIRVPGGIEQASWLQFKYSILLNDEVERLEDTRLLTAVDNWYGVRYKYGGSSKAGVDCSAFVSAVYLSAYGITLSRISADQYKYARHIAPDALKEGDLVFFHIRGKGVSHVGIYLRNNKFIHASVRDGVRVDDLGMGFYRDHLIGGGRMADAATAGN
jgi:hypothetical protein